jgi:uncharacterized membrane protein YdbT with pleckstrin-like domain
MNTIVALGLALTISAAEAPATAETGPEETRSAKATATEVVEATAVKAVVVESTRDVEAPSIITEVEQRESNRETAMDRQMAPRGSFWWMVGVIVIAGIILFVLVS